MDDKQGQKARKYRVDHGVNQTEAAVAIGRSQSWYSMFENDEVTPEPKTVERIFKAIDVLAELKHGQQEARRSHVSERLAGLRLPSRLDMANRPTARSK